MNQETQDGAPAVNPTGLLPLLPHLSQATHRVTPWGIALLGLLVGASLTASRPALAEGSAELGVQTVEADTVIYVDIIDSTKELMSWSGLGEVTVKTPTGDLVGKYSADETINPIVGIDGAYEFTLASWQIEDWDILVFDDKAKVYSGRVHSYEWKLDARTYEETEAFNGSFYALVYAGGVAYTSVIEMKTDGLAGYQWSMFANSTGVDNANGRSIPNNLATYDTEYAIYLNPPEKAAYSQRDPVVGELTFSGGATDCDSVAPGYSVGTFTFESDVDGSYHITCDLDVDGVFDVTSDNDLTLSGFAAKGTNTIEWDGNDNGGSPIAIGSYNCIVTVTVGEFHFVADDIETSFKGFRMYQVQEDGDRTPLNMYWNDEAVQDKAILMPNGEEGLVSPGPEGLNAGSYTAAAAPNVNARAWGDFKEVSKGNIALLDTYAWLSSSTTAQIDVNVIDGSLDTDNDGVSDIDELCTYGTDPLVNLDGYFHGGCATAPTARFGGLGAIAGLLALLGIRRRR